MKIDITNKTAHELINILNKFSNGRLRCEDKKVILEVSESFDTEPIYNPKQNPKQKNVFLKMFDTMSGYF